MRNLSTQFKLPLGSSERFTKNQVRSAKLVSDSRPPSLLFYFEIVGEL